VSRRWRITSGPRPVRWLAGHAVVRAAAGECNQVTIRLPWRAFAHWQDDARHVEPGRYAVLVGQSVTEVALHCEVDVPDHAPADWAGRS
jgi:beta-glucosidase